MAEGSSPAVKALACPACGAPVALRAAGYTVSVACAACGSTLDALAPDLALIERSRGLARRPRIELGTRGRLDGVDWDAVGYMERVAGSSRWSEYLLFNPYYGYRFLIDDGRRWSLGRLLDGEPKPGGAQDIVLEQTPLARFEPPYDATVRFVLGEFYWRVATGDTVRLTDYVAPGLMLSLEESEDESVWTRIDLLDRGVAEQAFGVPGKPTIGRRPSPHEPSPWRPLLRPFWLTAVAAFIVLLLACALKPDEMDLGGAELETRLDAETLSTVIGPVPLSRPYNRVVVTAWSNELDNQWIDADISLVNERDQLSYDGYALVEHYTGRDSDGPWSEGETTRKLVFSHVPAGQYDLVVERSARSWPTPVTTTPPPSDTAPGASASWDPASAAEATQSVVHSPQLGVVVATGGMAARNFWLSAAAIFLAPLALTYAHSRFERSRRGDE